jgi:DNA repair protein RecN (Recombination protein N)
MCPYPGILRRCVCKFESGAGFPCHATMCAKMLVYACRIAHPQLCHYRPTRAAFGPGLNILTGETGAGKSIIIDAVGLLLGDRAAAEWVRAGAELAEHRGRPLCCLPTPNAPSEVKTLLEEQGLDDPDSPSGCAEPRGAGQRAQHLPRQRAQRELADAGGGRRLLVDVHGQGEHLGLLAAQDARASAGSLRQPAAAARPRRKVQETAPHAHGVAALRQDARTMAQRLDMLSFQVDEIGAAGCAPVRTRSWSPSAAVWATPRR